MKGKKDKAPETMTIRLVETYCTVVSREPITINIADYPELEGMSEEEIKSYINQNAYEMTPTNSEYFDSLYDELSQMDVVREKITDEDSEIHFE